MDTTSLKTRVTEVLAILRAAEVPDVLLPKAFELVWQADSKGAPQLSPTEAASAAPLAALATRTGLQEATLADLFGVIDDGSLAVRIPARQLSQAKAKATQELALLTCAARQAVESTPTPARIIRRVCDEYGKLDAANFSSTLRAGDASWQISGKGAEIALQLRRPGWDEAGALMKRLAGMS